MNKKIQLLPVMLCFFAMGFVDLVGIASNYVQADLGLSDASANIFPSLVFFWFLIFSVPTSMLMNKIGRKNTVLLSLVVTAVSLLLPLFGETYGLMLVSFSLLGIGNIASLTLETLTGKIVNEFFRDIKKIQRNSEHTITFVVMDHIGKTPARSATHPCISFLEKGGGPCADRPTSLWLPASRKTGRGGPQSLPRP